VADKDKGKGIIISDPCTTNKSQAVLAQKAPSKKTNKTVGAKGQGDWTTDQSSMSRASQTVRCLCPDSPEPTRLANSAGRFGSNQRTLRPCAFMHRQPETGMSKNKSSKTSGRLVKVVPTFEKVVPCNWPTKQLRSPAKATRPNKIA
jgi:hypothetical protein